MKFNQKKSSKLTLSDKIAGALTLKPQADIEDDHVFGTKPQTVSRADFESSDSEDEAAISDFRKRSVNLLSEVSKKYEGVVVSRKDVEISEDDDIGSGDENVPGVDQDLSDSDTDSEKLQVKNPTVQSESDLSDAESDDYSITKVNNKIDSEDEDNDEEDEDDDDEGEGYDISQMEEVMKEQFEHVKKQNISEDAQKGICVRNQLLVWEGLLEMRIHLQRCMNTANQMPMPDTFDELKQSNEFLEESSTTNANIATILNKLLTLQNILLNKYPETKTLATKQGSKEINIKEDSDEEIPSDTDNEEIPSDTEPEDEIQKKKPPTVKNNLSTKKRKLEDYETEIANSHKAFKSFRDTSIQKWNDKTRLATAANIKNTPTNTILQQISYILSDKDKLVRRTQLKRTEYDIIGYKNRTKDEEIKDQNGMDINPLTIDRKDNDEYIPEIFDDSDFYHQLLRELIECKSADISDPVQLSRQWIALQQMRSKMKRKVDTKATKGRKIKYVVHNKLVNYMAPEKCTTWTDDSTNELYSSLFGKLFEHNNVGLNVGNVFQLK